MVMGHSCLTSFAYAKINLGLAITGKNEDGYHDLQTVMQSIELHDIISITRKGEKIVCQCGELSGPGNLAYRAADVFFKHLGRIEGVEIVIEKNIPIQAGLAGGSADAAVTLRLLNELYNQPLAMKELESLALACGADVVFCLHGGTMWASGRGERLETLPSLPETELILVKPEKGVNTGDAYRRFDKLGRFGGLNQAEWEQALINKDMDHIIKLLSNDLEIPSIEMVPEIAQVKELLLSANCRGVLMSGSGSAVFGIVRDRNHGTEVAEWLHGQGYSVWLTKTR